MAPPLWVIAGGPGAGKTTRARAILTEHPRAAYVNTAAVRQFLPEWQAIAYADVTAAHAITDEETDILVARLLQAAVGRGLAIIFDDNFAGPAEPWRAFMVEMKEAGYRVRLEAVDCDEAIAIERYRLEDDWRRSQGLPPLGLSNWTPRWLGLDRST